MRAQLKPLFGAELTFAKQLCEPNEAQIQQMKAMAKPELETALQKFAIQQAPMMGIQLGGRRVQNRKQLEAENIFNAFESATDRIVAEIFPAEEVALYREEQAERKAFRARSGAMALVAHLDSQFRLSQQQREDLTDELQESWKREWQHYLQILPNNPQFFPPVPNNLIVRHLNDVQAKLWRGLNKHQLGMHWQNLVNQGQFRNFKPEIDWFEDQPNAQPQNGLNFFGGAVFIQAVEEKVDEDVVDEEAEE